MEQLARHEVAEVFGYPGRLEASKTWTDYRCPFLGSRCIKKSQHRILPEEMPFGACSVWHKGRAMASMTPYIICPARFLQNNRIFHDALRLFNDKSGMTQMHHLLLPEVQLPVGRLDYVLVQWEPGTHTIRDFCVLEIMAVSTTMTGEVIRSLLDTLERKQPRRRYNYGINLRQVLSRMIVQVLAKAPAAEAWGIKTIWAIQDVLWNFMQQSTELRLSAIDLHEKLPHASYSIYFFVYGADTTTQPQYELYLRHICGGTQAELAQVLSPSVVPSREQIGNVLRERIQANQYVDVSELVHRSQAPT